jgi:hypothetical protein
MRTHLFRSIVWIGLLFALVPGVFRTLAAAEKTALDLLPPTTVGYLEVPQPGKLVGLMLDHPLTKEIEQQPVYQKAMAGREYQQIQAGLKLVEDTLGMKWRDAIERLDSGGLHVGFDLPTQGVVALMQASDESMALKACEAVLSLARADAAAKNRPDVVKQDELRGITIHEIGNINLVVLDKWLLASNKRLLVNMVLENYLGSSGVSLGSDEQFQSVRKSRREQAAAWLYTDLRVLRLTGVLRGVASKKSNNPVIELLAGGVLGVLPDATYATAALELDRSHLKLTARLPGNPQTVSKAREFYFGPEASGAAPPLLQPPGVLLALSAYRDFAALWRHAPDLFDERVNAGLAQAESNLATFFGGRNFRDEILGNLEPGVQLVVARQQFPQAGVTPAIKLPAAALVVRMKKPAETARTFKITFQSLMGFLNIIGGMKGVPPLDLNSEKMGEALVISTEYLPPDKEETRGEAPIHHNASPTAVFLGDRFILATARPLALDLIEQVQRQSLAAGGVNTSLLVDGRTVQSALTDNRGPLIARNMLDRGHDRTAAEREIDSLLRAITNLERSSVQLTADGRQVELAIDIAMAAMK